MQMIIAAVHSRLPAADGKQKDEFNSTIYDSIVWKRIQSKSQQMAEQSGTKSTSIKIIEHLPKQHLQYTSLWSSDDEPVNDRTKQQQKNVNNIDNMCRLQTTAIRICLFFLNTHQAKYLAIPSRLHNLHCTATSEWRQQSGKCRLQRTV